MLCGNDFQIFNCINNFSRSVITFWSFSNIYLMLLIKESCNYYKSKWGKYLPGWESSVRFRSCNKLNWAGSDSGLWVHYSVCTLVLRQRAALTGLTESREWNFIASELSEMFSSITYQALDIFPVSEHGVYCSEKGPWDPMLVTLISVLNMLNVKPNQTNIFFTCW